METSVEDYAETVRQLGGTAKDQLVRFMEVFHDLEATDPKIEALLGRNNDYLKKFKVGQAFKQFEDTKSQIQQYHK